MNVYVETNFVLELTFEQEQCSSCERILQWSELGGLKLIVPAYSLAEPLETLTRQKKSRQNLQDQLKVELRQIGRTASFESRISSIQDIANLLIQSSEEGKNRFINYRERLLRAGEVISLDANILSAAAAYEISTFDAPQDAIVYASVIQHLQQNQPQQACFLNRNSKDFDNPDIRTELEGLNCRLILNFDKGCDFVRSRLSQ